MNPDDELDVSAEDARFAQRIGDLYQPPAQGAAARARFAARLEARIARAERRRPWRLAAAFGASAAAALVLALLPGQERTPEATVGAALVEPASADESLLLLTNGPLPDPDEALPEDYQTLASLID